MLKIFTRNALKVLEYLTNKNRLPISSSNRRMNTVKLTAFNTTFKLYYSMGTEGNESSPKEKLKFILGNIKQDEKKSIDELERYNSNSWKTIRNSLLILGFSFTIIGTYFIYMSGRTRYDSDGEEIYDQYSDRSVVIKYLLRTRDELKLYQKMLSEPSREKLLPDALKDPYYQPPYTLVMEFTDVIVHPDWTYSTGWRFKKRPGFQEFLDSLYGLYEVVIYTSEMGMTVFPIMEAIDQKNIISYKLVRDATHFSDGKHLKDLSRLNRDLSKVIVVDWNSGSVKGPNDNLLVIPRWNGTDDDTSLSELSNFLRVIAYSDVKDVRDVLKYYRQFDDPLKTFRLKQKELAEMDSSHATPRMARDCRAKTFMSGLLTNKTA